MAGCAQTTLLKNGHRKAPTKSKVFKNRIHFEKSILTQIDTTAIYEKYNDNYYDGMVKQPGGLARHNYKNINTSYGVYRFYGNGCYSSFHLDRTDKPELTKEMFDPTYTGWRGVLYNKKNKLLGDLFTQIAQAPWRLGKLTEEFTFKGDTLIVQFNKRRRSVYIKRHIDPKLLEHIATW